ncbi:DUF1192 domain-containing protein [Citromicrobium bathyomarinum]|jgi:uncharacterized small protein (DUF1192 family)|uniref:DUF1192 domain-containing protein n=1 Tax=Sphingomonadales TaxID=204457 RepID=UPI0001DD0858|nr:MULTISPECIES: DUF1192 domain-containing protein [Sphingomonadales]MAO03878.1 DUF1192 domain-containing protein [Citromicrobium sp.]ALG59915.1 hypothetical protein WG74_02870 [Citromicrobium sp. JL477]KPM13255.1 hypothetical protein WG75_13585 [Citromicrobium sp. WPS32]KPM14442.1 hypothetical protein VM77_13185 [Citromicrobium sp. JL31]KPM16988.1 hypothetical protein VO58_03645 [Citromicrobium sp. JL1351]|tara:strand:- start:1097 stop:1303 length:207 start_codon:yes stop_codon:yes gene_type:complete
MEEDVGPRPASDAASQLAAEDLTRLSQFELDERIRMLQLEIARVEQHRTRYSQQRSAAEALFAKKNEN